MSLEVSTVTGPLAAEGAFADGVITVRLAGCADAETKSEFDVFIEKVQGEALRLAATKVTVDLRELEFMNSSCFKTFVSWLANIRELDPSTQYRIHFLSNPEHHWQRRSLAALSCFAVDLVAVDS